MRTEWSSVSSAPSFEVATRDPLKASELMSRLPEINRDGDVNALIAAVRDVLVPVDLARGFDVEDALAAVRDLGMLAASIRRHGQEPGDAVPGLEALLLVLGERSGMVPRDTVFHYGPWNPRGDRERTFTGDPNERSLIESTRIASPGLEAAVAACTRLLELDPTSPEFAANATECARQLVRLNDGILHARAGVDPMFFARTLRPYFEPIRVGTHSYAGAAAAPLSVGVIDHLLWSSDCADPKYRSFQDHGIEYNTPAMRELYASRLGQPSVISQLAATLTVDLATHARDADALDSIVDQLLKFRSRHVALARGAYSESIRKYAVGSAGYGIDTLHMILRLTKASRRKLHAYAWEA